MKSFVNQTIPPSPVQGRSLSRFPPQGADIAGHRKSQRRAGFWAPQGTVGRYQDWLLSPSVPGLQQVLSARSQGAGGAGGTKIPSPTHHTASIADPVVLVPSSRHLLLCPTTPGTLRSLGGLSNGFLHPQVPGLDVGVTHQVVESLQALHHTQHTVHCLGEATEGRPHLPSTSCAPWGPSPPLSERAQ